MQPLSAQALQQEGFIHSPRQLNTEVAKKFQFMGKLGEGSFGVVVSAIQIKSGKKVALKKIKLSKKHEGVPSSAMREIAILKSLNHQNIVKIHQVFYDYDLPQLCFVLDYHPYNLFQYIKQHAPIPTRKIQLFAYQIVAGVNYLHRKGIIHRDLKPHNFLISSEGQLKLCDLGQAKYTFFKPQQHTPDISTLWYRAPQILMGSTVYDEKVDVWAVGCIIAEIILGKPLFFATSQISLLFTIFQLLGTPTVADFPQIASMKDFSPSYPKFVAQGINIIGIPEQALDLLRKLLVINPAKRISIFQALTHQFFLGIEANQNQS